MRVLQFRSLCDTGGVSTSMLLLGRQLATRGIACEYWFCTGSNRLPEFQAQGSTTLGTISQLAHRLNRGDVDVVQMTASDPGAEIVAQLAEGKARVLVTARGALCDSWNRNTCFAYTAISKGMADVNQPYTDLQIEVVRNSIDLDRFTPASVREREADVSQSPIVAFVGRTRSNEKNFPRFTRIAARLVQRGARVWIADPHEGSWSNFEGTDAVPIAVERWSPVPNTEIADFYRAVASSNGVVLMTSRTEGFGNVAPEAAACGARVAAPDVMGLREAIVDGVTGRLFPADASDDAVATLLHEWMQVPYNSQEVSDATRAEFSPRAMMDAYAAIYARTTQCIWAGARPTPATTAEMPLLLEHLEKSRKWRANFAWKSAMDLGDAGFGAPTRQALTLAIRTAPAQFTNLKALRQFARIAKAIAGSLLRGTPPLPATQG